MKSFIQIPLVYLVVFVSLPAFFFFAAVPSASAATYIVTPCAPDGDCALYIYDLNLNKSVYAINEDILASGTLVQGVCRNGVDLGSDLNARNDLSGVSLPVFIRHDTFQGNTHSGWTYNWGQSGTATFTRGAGPSPVASGVTFSGAASFGNGYNVFTIATIPYTVSQPVSPTASLTVNGSHTITVNAGDMVKYDWSSTNGTSWSSSYTTTGCTDPSINTSGSPSPWPVSANGTTGNLSVDSSWAGCRAVVTYSATGPGGTASDNVNVIVNPLAPTATLSASPNPVDSGQSSTLTWGSQNATSCTAVGGFSTGGATSGSVSTGPLSSTQNYQISCTGSGGSANSNVVTVQVLTPTVSINAVPNRVVKGGTTTVSWDATNVNSCSIKKNGASWKSLPANGSRTVSGSAPDTITTQTTYVITCTNNASANAASAIVNVTSSFQGF